MEKTVATFLDNLSVGTAQTWKNLSVFPLICPRNIGLDYLLLDEALAQNCITISEISEGGSVPELKLDNRSDRMVLLLDGEELVGAKQNRVINTTILIAARTTIAIPVSCCEQGRWSYSSPVFSSCSRVMSSRMRAGKAAQVMENLRAAESYRADQGAIWDEIEARAERRAASSPSMAMAAIYEKDKGSLEEYRRHFNLVENQVGALIAINGKIVGLDCFGRQDTLAKVFNKLVDSYALDAIDWQEPEKKSAPPKSGPKKFIAALRAASPSCHQSVALGQDLRFESDAVSGFALIHEGNLLHLASFARLKESGRHTRASRLQRFSSRQSRYRS